MNTKETHTEWVARQVAQARETGIREGLENMTAAQLIAALYHECAKLAARVEELERCLRYSAARVEELGAKSVPHCLWPSGKCECMYGDES